jgi:hypothetical protein
MGIQTASQCWRTSKARQTWVDVTALGQQLGHLAKHEQQRTSMAFAPMMPNKYGLEQAA